MHACLRVGVFRFKFALTEDDTCMHIPSDVHHLPAWANLRYVIKLKLSYVGAVPIARSNNRNKPKL